MKYNIRKYFGVYSAYLCRMNKGSFRVQSPLLENFFERFPQTVCLNDFTITDIGEYIDYRLSKGLKRRAILMELQTLNRFWTYLIENLELKLYNPIKPHLPDYICKRPINKNGLLTLEEFKRLISACRKDYRLYLLGMVTETGRVEPFTATESRMLFQRAVKKAGLRRMRLDDFRRTLNRGLWKLIIKDYSRIVFGNHSDQQSCDSLVDKPQFDGDSLRTIEVPAIDIGTPIINNSDEAFSIGWVDDSNNGSQA
jgi:hypothetical protein